MSPETRADLEAQADRSLRRGDLAEAIKFHKEIAAAFPDDEAARRKLSELTESLQPSELINPKARFAAERESPATSSPEQEGERLFSLGDYAGAAAAYRRALTLRPDSELIRERLGELFRLAQATPHRSPTDQDLPQEPQARLRALLDRISSRKRVGRLS